MSAMVRVAFQAPWVCWMRPGFMASSWGSESISCCQNQVTLPVTSIWQYISTLEPRFLAVKRGYCQIWEQALPVGDKARINPSPLSQPLSGNQPSDELPPSPVGGT